MCGIAGIFKYLHTHCPSEVAQQIADIVAHRGPDDQGVLWMQIQPEGCQYRKVISEDRWNVALSHRRLSILDLSEMGHQPMSYQDHLWIVYNGEVYNFLELRADLGRLGHTFRSDSDTEVILAAFKEWGTACFSRFHGMWGLIIVDTQHRRVILCRDRMGIKPLYFWRNADLIAVGSEIKQFTTVPGFNPQVEVSAVREYLQTGYEYLDRTFFNDIYPVAAGHWIQIDLDTLTISEPQPYWFPEQIQPHITDIDEAGRLFEEQLHKSVTLHLRSDVPVGCALSGGLDSSSVVMLIDRLSQGRENEGLHTFTSTFPGESIDEREYVDALLMHIRAMPHFVTPDPEQFLKDFDRFVWIHDEPVGGLSVYASYTVARLARQAGVPVTLNGQGGDEIFAGYWQSYFIHLRDIARQGQILEPVKHLAGSFTRSGNPNLVRQVPVMLKRYIFRRKPLPLHLHLPDSDSQTSLLDQFLSLTDQTRRVHEIRYIHLPRLLKWDDRNSMAFSVEGRYPFLDHRVIELCLSFDSSILYHRGWTKWPLRVGLRTLLPSAIAQRRSKFGFLAPQTKWLETSLRPVLKTWLAQDRPVWDHVERNDVTRLAQEVWNSRGKKEEYGQALLRIFMLDRWLELFQVL